MSDPVTDAVKARGLVDREAQMRKLEAEMAKLPAAKELRAFFATPAGKAAAKELVEVFLMADPPGTEVLHLGIWLGAQKVVKWLLRTGGEDIPAIIQK